MLLIVTHFERTLVRYICTYQQFDGSELRVIMVDIVETKSGKSNWALLFSKLQCILWFKN